MKFQPSILQNSFKIQSKNFRRTLSEDPPRMSPPLGFESQRLVGGDEGEGEWFDELTMVHPEPVEGSTPTPETMSGSGHCPAPYVVQGSPPPSEGEGKGEGVTESSRNSQKL
jgi:hypothetical protein